MMQRDADPIKGAGKAEQPGEAELKKIQSLERHLEKKQDLTEEHFINVNPLNPLLLTSLRVFPCCL